MQSTEGIFKIREKLWWILSQLDTWNQNLVDKASEC